MAKNKMGVGKKALAFVFASLGLMSSGQGSSFINTTQYHQSAKKDTINQRHEAPRPVSFKNNFSGGDNPYKHFRKGVRNQKQYRQWIRQNPHKRRSKKCKI